MEKAKEQEQESSTRSQKFILARIPSFTLDIAQIKGVDSTVRENNVYLEANSNCTL